MINSWQNIETPLKKKYEDPISLDIELAERKKKSLLVLAFKIKTLEYTLKYLNIRLSYAKKRNAKKLSIITKKIGGLRLIGQREYKKKRFENTFK